MTCLCLTRNRRQWLPKAIQCYRRQSYRNRELLILADGEDVRDLVRGDDDSIRIVHIEEGRTIGEKRNFGAGLARGEIIAHWDDDDLSAPGRLADQVDRLLSSGKAVTGYSSMLFTDGGQWWRYRGVRSYAIGTSLCYRKDWWRSHPFAAKQVGEDGLFAIEANGAGQLVTADAAELMVASIHPGNTSPRQLVGDEWKRLPGFPGLGVTGFTEMNRLTVVIPTKTALNLIPCAEAAWKYESAELPIIVVDDGLAPDDGQREIFRRWDRERAPVWISGRKPFVFAANINIGIRKAGTADVILLNDDALLKTPGGFTLLQKAAAEHPEYGCIGAVTNLTGQPLQRPRGVGLREVRDIAFVCVLIPRRTIERIGLLDERYCLDYGVEDLDYCEAIRRAGLKVGIHDSCYVDHGSLRSTFRGDPWQPRTFAQNLRLFNQKWGLA